MASHLEKLAVSYAEGVANALVGKLGLLLIEQYKLLLGVRGDIALLRDDVAIMNSLLRMLAEADDGAVSHFVREWMKQVRELAYDAEDNIDVFVLRISRKTRCCGCLSSSLATTWHWCVKISGRLRLGWDIKDLRERARAISERRIMYNINREELQASKLFIPTTEVTFSGAINDVGSAVSAIGIKGAVDELVRKIKPSDKGPAATGQGTNDPQTSRGEGTTKQEETLLKVFAVVGSGGVGKTTLANAVYEELKKEAKVTVSQAFDASKDMGRLVKEILVQVAATDQQQKPTETPNTTDTEQLTILQGKRYLIMIDDVWTIKAWKAIRARLPENNQNSRVIVTTRMELVGKVCVQDDQCIHRVKPLGVKEAEDLFNNKVFGSSDGCPEELKAASKLILNKCGGIPLVIISFAGLMANYKSPRNIDMWDRVWKSMGSLMESSPSLEAMRQLITLSYNDLPHHLRACLMYLSIFPEDYHISKDRLLNRWIAEGLIPEKRGLTSLEVAEGFAEELVSRNLVEPILSDRRVTHYRVHDVMLEVILSKALEENFVTVVGGLGGGGTSSYNRVRRLSIQDANPRSFVKQKNIKHIRSLTTFRPQGHSQMLDRLKEFTLLRVLDLEDCKELKDHHLKHVCRLFLLRFLNLNGTDIEVLPSQIGDLLHLQTLWLYNTLLTEVPGSVTKLENLENLTFFNRERTWRIKLRLPQGLKKMKSLTSLPNLELRIEDGEIAKEIGDLVQLRKLHMVLGFNYANASNDRLVLDNLANSITSIHSVLRDFSVEDTLQDADNMKFLHGLRCPPLMLHYLTIGGKIDQLPDWVKSLTFLTEVTLWWVDLSSDNIFGVLCKVPNLLKITLDRKCCTDDKLVAKSEFKFMKLKELHIVPYGDQVHKSKHIEFEKGSMESLETLTVNVDRQYVESLEGVENLTSLKKVKLCTLKETREEGEAQSPNVDQSSPIDIVVAKLEEENNRRKIEEKFVVVFGVI